MRWLIPWVRPKMPPVPALLRSLRGCVDVMHREDEVEGKIPDNFAFVVDRRQRVENGVFILAVVVAG